MSRDKQRDDNDHEEEVDKQRELEEDAYTPWGGLEQFEQDLADAMEEEDNEKTK